MTMKIKFRSLQSSTVTHRFDSRGRSRSHAARVDDDIKNKKIMHQMDDTVSESYKQKKKKKIDSE